MGILNTSRMALWFISGAQSRLDMIDLLNLFRFSQPGVVVHACNPVTWRLGSLKGLGAGFLGAAVLWRSGVWRQYGEHRVV